MKLQYKLLSEHAVPPTKAHKDDVGYDLCIVEPMRIEAGRSAKVNTGVAMIPPPGYWIDVRGRGSSKLKGLLIEGVGDPNFCGSYHVLLSNVSLYAIDLKAGDRIAQAILLPVVEAEAMELDDDSWDELCERSARGKGAFGSSGASGRPGGNGG